MTNYSSIIHRDTTGTFIEVATIHFNGKDFTNLGMSLTRSVVSFTAIPRKLLTWLGQQGAGKEDETMTTVSTRYVVWYGNDGYTSDDTYDTREEALAAIASHMRWSNPVESDSYSATGDDGETVDRVSVYESEEACETEDRGTHAPTITEVQS